MSNSEFNKSDNEEESSTIDAIVFREIVDEINNERGQEAGKFRNHNETRLMELFDEWFSRNRSYIAKQMKDNISKEYKTFSVLLDIKSSDLQLYLFRGISGGVKNYRILNEIGRSRGGIAQNKGFSADEVKESFIGYINKKIQGITTDIKLFNDDVEPGQGDISLQIIFSTGGRNNAR